MDSNDWDEFLADYDTSYRPKIAAERNLVAAVADLRGQSTLTPAVKTAPYTLTEADHGRVIFLGAGSDIAIPAGLPVSFRCSLRNLTTARLVSPFSNVLLNGYPHSGDAALLGVDELNLDLSGSAELAFSALNVAELHGDVVAS